MHIYQTKLQRLRTHLPSPIEFSTAAYNRQLLTTKQEIDQHHRLIVGNEGEEKVFHYLQKYGLSHWGIVRNLWQDYYGAFESDLILFTHHKIYVFEIKNYHGLFTFKDGISQLDGRVINGNSFQQARRAMMNIQNICSEINAQIRVEGAVIFPNANNYIQILSSVEDVRVISSNYLMLYIKEIIQEDKNYSGQRINPDPFLARFQKYEIVSPFFPEAYSKIRMNEARKGIACGACHSYSVEVGKLFVQCHCGYTESREEALLRSIRTYCVLTYGHNFTRRNIANFIDGKFSKTYLLKNLPTHYQRINNGRSTQYANTFKE